jgi:degradative hydroxymethylglutaryl-CoA reductase
VESLKYKDVDGEVLAERLIDAYAWAASDVYRAVTHNKGIMNGIDAVAMATGQDWRAIEAACHAYASIAHQKDGYRSLSEYWIEDVDGVRFFCGQLTLPIAVGTKGGSILSNPAMRYTHGLLSFPDSGTLAQVRFVIHAL